MRPDTLFGIHPFLSGSLIIVLLKLFCMRKSWQKLAFAIVLALSFCKNTTAQTLTVTGKNPSDKTSKDGQIVIHGLAASTAYTVSYDKNGIAVDALDISSDVNGNVVISTLDSANYSNFTISTTDANPTVQHILTTVTLVGGAIATQATKFFGAVYANFTGVPDDDPPGFVQTYARLSQYLNAKNGISSHPEHWC